MRSIVAEPARGDVWLLNLDPTTGREQSGTRPALVVSADGFNSGLAGLVIVCPITIRHKNIRSHVEVEPPEAGLTLRSFVKCEDVRSVSKERLIRYLGSVAGVTLSEVEDKLRMLMAL